MRNCLFSDQRVWSKTRPMNGFASGVKRFVTFISELPDHRIQFFRAPPVARWAGRTSSAATTATHKSGPIPKQRAIIGLTRTR